MSIALKLQCGIWRFFSAIPRCLESLAPSRLRIEICSNRTVGACGETSIRLHPTLSTNRLTVQECSLVPKSYCRQQAQPESAHGEKAARSFASGSQPQSWQASDIFVIQITSSRCRAHRRISLEDPILICGRRKGRGQFLGSVHSDFLVVSKKTQTSECRFCDYVWTSRNI